MNQLVTDFLKDVYDISEIAYAISKQQAFSPEDKVRISNASVHLRDAIYALRYDETETE